MLTQYYFRGKNVVYDKGKLFLTDMSHAYLAGTLSGACKEFLLTNVKLNSRKLTK